MTSAQPLLSGIGADRRRTVNSAPARSKSDRIFLSEPIDRSQAVRPRRTKFGEKQYVYFNGPRTETLPADIRRKSSVGYR